MRVLVTGNAGFVGRHVHAALDEQGHDVTGVDIKLGRDALDLYRHSDTRYDVIVHLAANVGGRAAIDNQPLWIARNLALDQALFEYADRTRCPHVIYPSSSAAYPVELQQADSHQRLREHDIDHANPRQPDAMYGWTKLTGERLAAATNTPVSVIRPFSGYGADQGQDYPFGAFLARALTKADPFIIWGDGTQTRDWVHIDDITATILAIIEQRHEGTINIGTGTPTDMITLAELFTQAVGYRPQLAPLATKPTGVAWRVADTTQQIRTHRISIERGVHDAIKAGGRRVG